VAETDVSYESFHMKTHYPCIHFQLQMMFLLQVFDFELSKAEVEELDSLDKRAAGRRFKMDTYKG
jgi:hypothetical protein